jgi:hypothetical protein
MKKLINHCKNKLANEENIVLVVTGDIIHQGVYKKNNDLALEFFKQLKSAFTSENKSRIKSVQIIPGNHDKDYGENPNIPSATKLLSYSMQAIMEYQDDEEKVREITSVGYKKFIELRKNIYEIFDKLSEHNETFGINTDSTYQSSTQYRTYGVDVFWLKNELTRKNENGIPSPVFVDPVNLVFFNLDTTISSELRGENERGKQIIGQKQISNLVDQYNSKCESLSYEQNTQKKLVFCLTHHPITYLNSTRWYKNGDTEKKQPSQYDLLHNALTSRSRFNADFLLNGHIHNRDYGNIVDRTKVVQMLTTGIGWPDDTNIIAPVSEHRYAIYTFDDYDDGFSIQMYEADPNQDNEFGEDKFAGENFPIYRPLPCYNQPLYTLKSVDAENTLSYLWDTHTMKYVKELNRQLCNFSRRAAYERAKTNRALRKIINKENFSVTEIAESDQWLDFFKQITDLLSSHLTDYFFEKSCSPTDVIKHRVVLRIYDRTCDKPTGLYKNVYHSPIDEKVKPSYEFKWKDNNDKGSLIKYAFDESTAIVYSLNKTVDDFSPTSWDDFIVFTVPAFDYRALVKRVNEMSVREMRAGISFGISVKTEGENKRVLHNKLLLLQQMEINKVVNDIIESAIKNVEIEMSEKGKKLVIGDVMYYLLQNSKKAE